MGAILPERFMALGPNWAMVRLFGGLTRLCRRLRTGTIWLANGSIAGECGISEASVRTILRSLAESDLVVLVKEVVRGETRQVIWCRWVNPEGRELLRQEIEQDERALRGERDDHPPVPGDKVRLKSEAGSGSEVISPRQPRAPREPRPDFKPVIIPSGPEAQDFAQDFAPKDRNKNYSCVSSKREQKTLTLARLSPGGEEDPQTPSPVESTQTPSPVESTQTTSPVESTQTTSPVESTQTTSPVESLQTSSPVESTQTPSPVESLPDPPAPPACRPASPTLEAATPLPSVPVLTAEQVALCLGDLKRVNDPRAKFAFWALEESGLLPDEFRGRYPSRRPSEPPRPSTIQPYNPAAPPARLNPVLERIKVVARRTNSDEKAREVNGLADALAAEFKDPRWRNCFRKRLQLTAAGSIPVKALVLAYEGARKSNSETPGRIFLALHNQALGREGGVIEPGELGVHP